MRFSTLAALLKRVLPIYARGQSTDPTRVGLLAMVQAGAVRYYGGRSVRSKGAHAKCRGEGDSGARVVCNVDSRPGTILRSAPSRTPPPPPPTNHWLNAPTTPSCCTPRPSRGHNARRAPRRPPEHGVSLLRDAFGGRSTSGYNTPG